MNHPRIRHLATLALAAALALASGCGQREQPTEPSEPLTQDEPTDDCIVNLTPGESIQAAIDEAPVGTVICLAAGVWEEHLTIDKPLTLRGTGRASTTIRALEAGAPVIHVQVSEGRESPVVISRLAVTGGTQLGGDGIRAVHTSQTVIVDVLIEDNWCGVFGWHDAHVSVTGTEIRQNEYGIWMRDSSRIALEVSAVASNTWDGVFLRDAAEASIEGSRIYANGRYGVVLAEAPCFPIDAAFAGSISGLGNTIPGPAEEDGNEGGAVCPGDLAFLMTSAGGEMDRRE